MHIDKIRHAKKFFSEKNFIKQKNESNSKISLEQKIEFSSTKIDDLERETIVENTISENESAKAKIEKFLMTTIKNVLEKNDIFIKLKQVKMNEDKKSSHKMLKKKFKLFMKSLIIKNDILYLRNQLIVFASDELRLRLLKKYHDSFVEKHLEYKTMFHAMISSYF